MNIKKNQMENSKLDLYSRLARTMKDSRPAKPQGWKKELSEVLLLMAKEHAVRDKQVSHKTEHTRKEVLFMCFNQLHDGDLKLRSVFNIRSKHLEYLFARWENEGLAAATLQQRHSILNTFSKWIGKAGLVVPLERYLKDPKAGKRVYVAKTDKSWTPSGVSPDELISTVCDYDERVGMQLKLIHAFGLRKKEAVMFRPWTSATADGATIQIYQGTKGGRYRVVPITSEYQRMVLKQAQEMAPTLSSHIADPSKTLEQNMRRLQYVLERFGVTKKALGVTAHGLRHEFANERYQELTGEPSPLQGGNSATFTSEQGKRYRRLIAEELGHSRISVTTAYYGSARQPKGPSK